MEENTYSNWVLDTEYNWTNTEIFNLKDGGSWNLCGMSCCRVSGWKHASWTKSCKQKEISDATYYAKLKKLWDELANYEKVFVCDCEKTMTELKKWHEKENFLQFLFGLDIVVFGTIRSSIFGENPLPIINEAYSKVIQEEQV